MDQLSPLTISCPQCNHHFSPEKAIETSVREKMEYELTSKVREQTTREFTEKYHKLEEEKKEQANRIRDFEVQELSWKDREDRLARREEEMELTLRKKLLEQEATIRQEADRAATLKASVAFQEEKNQLEKQREQLELQLTQQSNEKVDKVRTESELRVRDLLKQIDDQKKLVDELKRKSEQGSTQLQGEVQELALEEYLRSAFPHDEIVPVGKGVHGADCIQIIKNSSNQEVGRVIFESKRTKHFGGDWTEKLKADMRASNCEVAILVTEVFPKDMVRFGLLDGVWVCSFPEMKSLSMVVRAGLVRAGDLIAAQNNQGDKMKMLYDYLTGTEFRNHVENIVDSLSSMKSDLEKEKKAFIKIWSEREKQIDKIAGSTLQFFGSVKGIAGTTFQDLTQIDFLQEKLLT